MLSPLDIPRSAIEKRGFAVSGKIGFSINSTFRLVSRH
jgi:hypothetical protein